MKELKIYPKDVFNKDIEFIEDGDEYYFFEGKIDDPNSDHEGCLREVWGRIEKPFLNTGQVIHDLEGHFCTWVLGEQYDGFYIECFDKNLKLLGSL